MTALMRRLGGLALAALMFAPLASYAQIKISELPVAASVADADRTIIVQGTTTKSATAGLVRAGLATSAQLAAVQALVPGGASPSASVGVAAVNGVAATFMRSDAAPALDQSIAPTWTGTHSFSLIQPRTTATYDLGTVSLKWRDLYLSRNAAVAGQITLSVATGTAPLVVSSTTNVPNLNASSLNGATFAAPGPIGSGTPSTVAATTLSASSTVSGAGFTAYLASPPAIGGTAAAAISGTTGTFSGLLKGAGTTTNDNAAAGNIGEYKETIVLIGSEVSLTTGTSVDVGSISLSAGDYMVSGQVCYDAASGTTVSGVGQWISATSATIPTPPAGGLTFMRATLVMSASTNNCFEVAPQRISISGTTTYFLSAFSNFATSTLKAYGKIATWRMR